MGRWLIVLILTSATALAKDQVAAPASSQAWTKGLENAVGGMKLFDLRTGRAPAGSEHRDSRGPKALRIRSATAAAACAHIQVIPVDPEIDRGIVIGVPGGDQGSTSRMPVYKGLPPCSGEPR
jgi:hypothetical protein